MGWMCAGVIVFFALHQARSYAPTVLDTTVSCFLYPLFILQSMVTTPVIAGSSWFVTTTQLQKKILELEKEVDFFKNQTIALAGTYEFEKETEEVRAYKQQYEHMSVQLVRVLHKILDTTEQSMYIQGGLRRGFAVNMPVIYKNCIVGKISQVFPYYSKVTLITDPTCKIGARCLHSEAQGIFQGTQQLREATLTHVTHLASLQEGDLVLSSGDGLIFPHGFGLARVVSFVKEDLFYNVVVEPLVDVSQITYCYVFDGAHVDQKLQAKPQEIPS